MRLFAIVGLFLGVASAPAGPEPAPAPRKAAPFPVLPEATAWSKLPPEKHPPLPEWARIMAGPLPKTTAKMLELDYFHRVKNPLGPVVSANIRGVVADVLGSKYGLEVARMDAAQAVLSGSPLPDGKDLSLAVEFASKLTLEGHAITDKEFAEVLKYFGPEKTTAIVHTVAYANFQNRILLALGVKGESPVAPPVAAQFDTDAAKTPPPARPPWDDLKAVTSGGLSVRAGWDQAAVDVNAAQEKQKARSLRIPLPDKSVYDKLPQREKDSAAKILWNTVSMGYQPEMVRAWFACLYAFYEESKPDRVFTNSVFWVVTRTNDCFY